MIDTNKLLGNRQPPNMQRGRNIVTIKRNLIKIDSLLKEKLVLFKVRNGIMQQEEENRRRRSREEDLEKLRVTDDDDGSRRQRNKSNNLLGGLIAGLIGLSALFLPQMIRLFNFLRRILSPITKMITTTLKALTSFLTFGKEMVDKVSASFDFKVLSKTNIEKSFAKFSGAIDTFVNTLLTVAAFQALSNFPDLKSIKKFFQKIKLGSKVTTGNQIPIDDKFLLQPSKASKAPLNVLEKIFDLRNLQEPIETFSIPIIDRRFRVNPKGRKINPEDGRFFARRRKPTKTLEQIKLDEAFQKEFSKFVMPEFPIFDFLEKNKMKSPTRMAIELNKIYTEGKNMLAQAIIKNVIDFDEFFELSDIFDYRYQKQMLEIGQYGEDVLKLIKNTAAQTMSPKELSAAKKIFDKTQKNIINEEFFEGFNKGRKITKKTAEETIKNFAEKPINRNIGAAAASFFPKTMPDLIYPSMFERGRSALFEAGEFIKGIDKTMVDLATKQTDKIAGVITSGPLKGFTQSAKGMFRKAVGETIGLVPFLGDLIGLLLDIYLFGEIPERAGYKALGGILGGFIGALIGSIPALVPFGGPIIGSIIGGIGGDILGGIVYDIVKGQEKKVSAPVKPVKEVIKKTFGKGGFTGKGDSRKIAGQVHYNEQVLDPDTTLAVRQNAPGFLEDLNRAKGFESLEVLRNYASYEGTDTRLAHFIPIPLPIATNQGSSEVIIIGSEKKSNSIAGSHHDR